MAQRIKRVVFQMSKWLGLFELARKLTQNKLRILCYHGTSLSDESAFRPQLFIRPSTFERRLAYLQKQGFPVLGLEEAVERMRANTLPACATVITIDDGFFSTYCSAIPALLRRGFPATVYVTSYYVEKKNPVFRLAVQYLFWATAIAELSWEGLGLPFSGVTTFETPEQKDRVMWRIIEHAETQLSEPERHALTERLARRLGVDFQRLVEGRHLSLMTREEITAAAGGGVDIQLHTHRHRFPEDEQQAVREIQENRAALEPLVGRPMTHLCFPSGIWSEMQWPWLSAQGIKSATTCEPGLVDAAVPVYALSRFLDGENISQIEFEAELSGFSELLRAARRRWAMPSPSRAKAQASSWETEVKLPTSP